MSFIFIDDKKLQDILRFSNTDLEVSTKEKLYYYITISGSIIIGTDKEKVLTHYIGAVLSNVVNDDFITMLEGARFKLDTTNSLYPKFYINTVSAPHEISVEPLYEHIQQMKDDFLDVDSNFRAATSPNNCYYLSFSKKTSYYKNMTGCTIQDARLYPRKVASAFICFLLTTKRGYPDQYWIKNVEGEDVSAEILTPYDINLYKAITAPSTESRVFTDIFIDNNPI